MFATLFIAAACASPALSEPTAQPIRLELPATLVSGLPVPAKADITGPAEFPKSGPFMTSNPMQEIVLTGEGTCTAKVFRSGCSRDIDWSIRRNPFGDSVTVSQIKLADGAHESVLIELMGNSFVTELGVPGRQPRAWPVGEYRVTAKQCLSDAVVVPERVEVRAPNTQEEKLIKFFGLQGIHGGIDWKRIVIRWPESRGLFKPEEFSEAGRQQMSYMLLLADLVHSHLPIAELTITPDQRRQLWSGFTIERELLEYEIAAARADDAEKQRLRAQILADRASAATDLAEIDAGHGLIATLRREAAARIDHLRGVQPPKAG